MRNIAVLFFLIVFALGSCINKSGGKSEEGLTALNVREITRHRKIIVIEKQFLYDKYTLTDTFPYRDTVRVFQWDKIRVQLAKLDSMLGKRAQWGIVNNRNNNNGAAAVVKNYSINAYKSVQDAYGTGRRQAAPLYVSVDSLTAERYALDGSLAKIIYSAGDSIMCIEPFHMGGNWIIHAKYVKKIVADTLDFRYTIFVDRTNQNIVTMERVGPKWIVRSMNPATTGLHKPPYQMETPLGVFVLQEKKNKMIFLEDGTTQVGGFAPFANRFSGGAYIHGVPVNLPHTEIVEYSWSLGTTPRSHMCVRNATSHAEFVYGWAPVDKSLVFVIE